MIYFAYACSWISCAAASIAGMYLTNSKLCLLVLLLPSMISINTGKDIK